MTAITFSCCDDESECICQKSSVSRNKKISGLVTRRSEKKFRQLTEIATAGRFPSTSERVKRGKILCVALEKVYRFKPRRRSHNVI